MRGFAPWAGALALAAIAWTGCNSQTEHGETTASEGENSPAASVTLCGDCGQFKGTDVCCNAEAPKCDGCSLAKGSPGCCKIEADEDVALCTGCGQAKGTTDCCKADAPQCDGCELAKGSPGCCKMPGSDG